jgi:outer membrane protein insertion porin family
MIKHACLVVIAAVCMLSSVARSQEAFLVTVLPFHIHDTEELAYLKDQIPALIEKHLASEGAAMVAADVKDAAFWEAGDQSEAEARKLGIKMGVDYIIWGSLARRGQNFNLDAEILTPLKEGPARSFSIETEGIENLLSGVQKLSKEISSKLFDRKTIAAIIITGNRRIETDAIEQYIKTKPGDPYIAANLSNDLKAVYAMGYFDDIRVEYSDTDAGRTITFHVKEKPTIRRIRFKGNRVFDEDEIKESLNIKSGSILNIFSIQNNIIRIENLYKEKNYHNVKVTYKIDELENNQGDLQYNIEEGKKLRIKEINFEGNTLFDDKELKKIIETSEKGFWSFITSSGDLDKEKLRQDVVKLQNFYNNNGFIEAKVGEPQVEYIDDMIYIKIKIDEGPKYRVGKVGITGDLIASESELMGKLKITGEEFYSREVVHNDVLVLNDTYSDKGYAYVDIYPRIDKDPVNLKVNLEYVIKKGKKVYFELIDISGNKRTRDKVIRRELNVYEQELFSGKELKRGIRNLYRLDYFQDVKVDTVKGSADDKIVLKVDVEEKSTGQLQFGGGYSTIDYGYLMGSIAERNLFGRGQTLSLKSTISGKSTAYTLSFTEPYLFDTHISAGFDIYKTDRDDTGYDKRSEGGRIKLGFPVVTDTRLYWWYTYDVSDIYNIEEDAAKSIWEMEGENITSSTQVTLRYDTRDNLYNPTEGTNDFVAVEYAGLGGDIAFTKYTAGTSWYFPMFSGTVGMINGKAGYVHENGWGFLPDYERFYLGGMYSVRGFKWKDIHTQDASGDTIGGNSFVQMNLEWSIPLIKEAGMVWVFFIDAGGVFGEDEPVVATDIREGGGGGIRWYSPLGPIRLEYGWILDPRENESTQGRWEFAIGTSF